MLDTFAANGDIYCATASRMYHVPVEKHGINAHLRQKGKQATLSCIAEGQLTLPYGATLTAELTDKNIFTRCSPFRADTGLVRSI